MALTPGTRLGIYEITAQIGAGGMGEVYRATDTNLKRQVALKVLPESVAADPDRLARFQREAEVLAALNHPHIAQIYGLEKTANLTALVMELVEGEDLSQRIARGGGAPRGLPIDEALAIAKQIAEALEAAHEQGIIHRDLKPANIKVRPDGTVKVLDFGLAKAMEPAAGSSLNVTQSPTITSPAMTAAGMILGTAAYMSPEQARGRAVDKRSDIWAFGCVLYEMLSGVRPFDGDDVSSTLAAVLMKEPNWDLLPQRTPTAAVRLLHRCLQKDRRRRLDSASAAGLDLDDAVTRPAAAELPRPGRRASLRWLVVTFAVALASGLLTFALTGRTMPEDGARPGLRQFAIPPPPGVTLADDVRQPVALSADGRVLVIKGVANGVARFYARRLDQPAFVPVAGSERATSRDLGSVFLSPDGAWIGFHDVANGRLSKLPIAGGTSSSVVRFNMPAGEAGFFGAAWGSGDVIVFAAMPSAGLMQVSAAGGEPHQVAVHDGGRVVDPAFLHDNRVSYSVNRAGSGIEESYVLALGSGKTQRLANDALAPRSLGRGHLIFGRRQGSLWAAPFDDQGVRLAGPATPLLEDVASLAGSRGQGFQFGTARDGAMFYVPSANLNRSTVVWLDSQGRESEPAAGLPSWGFEQVRVSPDGDRVALGTNRTDHVWLYSLSNRTVTRLLPDVTDDRYPLWSKDGQRVLFTSNVDGRPALFSVTIDGGTAERLFTPAEGATDVGAEGWTPDGRTLVFYEARNGQTDLGILPNSGKGPAQVFARPRSNEGAPRVSPDGTLIAYHFVGADGEQVLSAEIALRPGGIAVIGRTTVATGAYLPSNGPQRPLDEAPDGRLAVIKRLPRPDGDNRAGQVIFLENVIESLEAPAPAGATVGESPR